ncbi:MAG: hypothetical protein WCH83_06670 [Alphaproteobacteria bacterium]
MSNRSTLPDAGPAPWRTGSGLTFDDMQEYGLEIFTMRVNGISLDNIAAHFGWSRAHIASVLARIAEGTLHDLETQGLPTDPNVLDRLARDVEWPKDGAR